MDMFGKNKDKGAKHEKEFLRKVTRSLSRADEKRQRGDIAKEGTLTILASRWIDHNSPLSPAEQISHVDEAAEIVREMFGKKFEGTNIVRPTCMEICFALQDPTVAGVAVVGHGSMGSIYSDDGKNFSWYDVARANKNALLKRFIGKFACDNIAVAETIPFGLPAMGDPMEYISGGGQRVDDVRDMSNYRPYFQSREEATTEAVIEKAIKDREKFRSDNLRDR